jgi:hypothetical protein
MAVKFDETVTPQIDMLVFPWQRGYPHLNQF